MNFNKRNPCPICGATDYCAYIKSQNGYLITCHKIKQTVKKHEIVNGIDGKEYIFLYEKNGCYMFEEKEQYETAKKAYFEGIRYKADKHTSAVVKTSDRLNFEDENNYKNIKVSHNNLNEVYRTLLNQCELSKKHIEMLKYKEKWTDDLIKKSDYFSTPDLNKKKKILEEIKKNNITLEGVPGFFTKNNKWTFNMVSGMILPVYDIDKKIIRLQIRPDWNYWQIKEFEKRGEKPPKYINFSSNGKENGTRSGSVAGIHYNNSNFKTVIVTEGSKDARIASEYLKRPCVYLPGVNTYTAFINSELFKELRKRNMENIIIAYDADITSKPQVKMAMKGFYTKLRDIGFNVYYAKWDLNKGKGIGDLILNGYEPAIYKILIKSNKMFHVKCHFYNI